MLDGDEVRQVAAGAVARGAPERARRARTWGAWADRRRENGTVARPRDTTDCLAAFGLAPGPDGWDAADLAAAVEGRGWRWSVEPAGRAGAGYARRPVFRAMVFAPGAAPDGRPVTGLRAYRGRGASEGEALALAVARLLAAVRDGVVPAIP